MPYAFFRVPAAPEPGAVEELNRFLRSHSVLAVQREWVSAGDASFWAFCIHYGEAAQSAARGANAPKVDYKEVLTEAQFALYVKLRELRKRVADRDGVPVFAVFTNEQLAEMTKKPVRTAADLKSIAGVGEGRVEKFGAEILAAINENAPRETPL